MGTKSLTLWAGSVSATPGSRKARIQRHLAALDAGLDPALVVERTQAAQADHAKARAVLAEHEATATQPPLTEAAVRAVIKRYRGLLDAAANPEERWALYSALGLALTYHRHPGAEYVTGTLGVLLRVGGRTHGSAPLVLLKRTWEKAA